MDIFKALEIIGLHNANQIKENDLDYWYQKKYQKITNLKIDFDKKNDQLVSLNEAKEEIEKYDEKYIFNSLITLETLRGKPYSTDLSFNDSSDKKYGDNFATFGVKAGLPKKKIYQSSTYVPTHKDVGKSPISKPIKQQGYLSGENTNNNYSYKPNKENEDANFSSFCFLITLVVLFSKALLLDTPFNFSEHLGFADATFLGIKTGEILNFEISSSFGSSVCVIFLIFGFNAAGAINNIEGYKNLNWLRWWENPDYKTAWESCLYAGLCLIPPISLCLLLGGSSSLMFLLSLIWCLVILRFLIFLFK